MLKRISTAILPILQSPYFILPFVCFLAYGILIPWLGLYADDLTFIWTFEVLKENGVFRYFTYGGNRPFWGLFYSLFVPLLGHQPEVWHLFGIFWLLICGLLIYKLFDLLFPKQKQFGIIAGSFFIVYPGMQLQFISLTFGHMWLIYAFFLVSINCSILSIKNKNKYLLFSIIGVLSSTINLLSFEYFIMLELLRPFILWFVIRRSIPSFKEQITKTIRIWFPYFLLLLGIIIWRLFFFELQTIRYQFSLIDQLKLNPIETVLGLIPTVITDIFWSSLIQAWGQIFTLPFTMDWSSRLNLVYLTFSIISMGFIFIWLHILDFKIEIDSKSRIIFILIGFFGLFFAGWPFWVTGLDVEPSYWNSRFTMPFMVGMVFVISGLLASLPKRKIQRLIISLLLGFSVGFQFQIANDFRRDWIVHNDIMQQLSLRLGELEKGTLIISNDLPIKYQSDNTLSAELNWIAAKGKFNPSPDYYLGYISELRRFGIPYDENDVVIKKDMISATYYGSTNKVIAIYFKEGSCLRTLNPRLDQFNPLIKDEIKEAALFSNENLINPNGITFELNESIYGKENDDECFTFQKAALLKQVGKWEEINKISDQIDFGSNMIKRDPMLAIVFLDSFIHSNNFGKAYELTVTIHENNSRFSPVLCEYWVEQNNEYLEKLPDDLTELLNCYR